MDRTGWSTGVPSADAARYREHEEGVDQPFTSPLFNTRSLFRHG